MSWNKFLIAAASANAVNKLEKPALAKYYNRFFG